MDILVPPGLPARQTHFLCLLAARPSLTRADYQRLVGISHKTAKADIANLVAQDLVVPIGAGRTRRYAPSSTLFGARLPVTDRPLIRITIEHLTITPLARRA
jgi:hypothetical protein